MGLLNLARRAFGGSTPLAPRAAVHSSEGGVVIRSPQDLADYLRAGRETASGAVVSPDSAMRVAAVFGCVRIIAGAVATMPLNLKRRVDERTREDASDHALWPVLRRRPNRWMTPSGFRRMMTAHVLLRGNAYALIVRSGERVLELIPMHPDRVTVKQLDDLSLVYTYTRKDGRQLVLPQHDVFHLIGLTLDGITGVSVIEYARETIGLAIQTERHGATVFKNGTQLGAVLKHPGKLGKDGQDSLRESLEAYRGAENAHKTLIIEEGMDYIALGMTAEDAQYIETRKFSRGDIAMFFGVPPHMIGDTEKATSWGSGIEQQSLGFVAYTLQDWLTTWEETIARDLLTAANDNNVFAKFNPAGLVRGDIKTRYAAYATGRQWGWLSVNDIRELEDLNPIENGDTYLEPLNMVPVGTDRTGLNDPENEDVRNNVVALLARVGRMTEAEITAALGVAA